MIHILLTKYEPYHVLHRIISSLVIKLTTFLRQQNNDL